MIWVSFLVFATLSFYGGWGLARGKDWSVVKRAKAIIWINGPVLVIVDETMPIVILGIEPTYPEFIGRLIGSAISAGIWTAYLSRSKRVRATYDPTYSSARPPQQ